MNVKLLCAGADSDSSFSDLFRSYFYSVFYSYSYCYSIDSYSCFSFIPSSYEDPVCGGSCSAIYSAGSSVSATGLSSSFGDVLLVSGGASGCVSGRFSCLASSDWELEFSAASICSSFTDSDWTGWFVDTRGGAFSSCFSSYSIYVLSPSTTYWIWSALSKSSYPQAVSISYSC